MIVSEVFRGRLEGSLTSVSSLSKLNGEVAVEDLKRSALIYSTGSIIALPSGLQGTIISWKMDNNQVIYETELTNGKIIGLRNTGNNITLVQGEETLLCLDCGSDGINKREFVCPMCGASLQ